MKVVGIDLSGPRNFADTCLVSFEERGDQIHLQDVRQGANDEQILEAVSSLGQKARINIGIDAPLSYNSTGGDRPSDAELRRLVNAKGRGIGIMPPTMIRMVYLTLRGVTLARLLETFKPQYDLGIVEVHPGACMLLRGVEIEDVTKFKSDRSARERLLHWLENTGVKGLSQKEAVTDHYVAACAAALGAWQWGLGKSAWRFAADPPYHPYDFVC
jgi:predicted nuclease with RNAse H fold